MTMISSTIVLVCGIVALQSLQPSSASSVGGAAGNQYRYNAYNYDRTTPQFTPDGRLLQVEYASSAAQHSSPLLVLQVDQYHPRDDQQQKQRNGDDDDAAEDDGSMDQATQSSPTQTTFILMSPCHDVQSTQQRLVILEDPSTLHRDTQGTQIVMAMSGVLADNLALVQVALQDRMERLRSNSGINRLQTSGQTIAAFGHTTNNEVLQIAHSIADKSQQHSFGGGIRPFGSTMLIAGIVQGCIHLYQTDPSGAIVPVIDPNQHDNTAIRSNSLVLQSLPTHRVTLRWVVGGTLADQSQLKTRLEKSFRKHPRFRFGRRPRQQQQQESDPAALSHILRQVGTEVIDYLNEKEAENEPKPDAKQGHNKNRDGRKRERKNNSSDGDDDDDDREGQRFNSMEAILLSTTHGIHRVTRKQARKIFGDDTHSAV